MEVDLDFPNEEMVVTGTPLHSDQIIDTQVVITEVMTEVETEAGLEVTDLLTETAPAEIDAPSEVIECYFEAEPEMFQEGSDIVEAGPEMYETVRITALNEGETVDAETDIAEAEQEVTESVAEADTALTETEPEINETDPQLSLMSEEMAAVIESDLSFTEAEPAVTEAEPVVTEAEPVVTEAELVVTATEAAVTEAETEAEPVLENLSSATLEKDTSLNVSQSSVRTTPRSRTSKYNAVTPQ